MMNSLKLVRTNHFAIISLRGCVQQRFCAPSYLQGGICMSVVIIGGHDRMVSQYKKICKSYNCKANVFTQMSSSLDKQIGRPDLLVLFTNTVSHKMIRCALDEVNENETEIVRCHTSSGSALTEILMQKTAAC